MKLNLTICAYSTKRKQMLESTLHCKKIDFQIWQFLPDLRNLIQKTFQIWQILPNLASFAKFRMFCRQDVPNLAQSAKSGN